METPKCRTCKEPMRHAVNQQAFYCADPTCERFNEPVTACEVYEVKGELIHAERGMVIKVDEVRPANSETLDAVGWFYRDLEGYMVRGRGGR